MKKKNEHGLIDNACSAGVKAASRTGANIHALNVILEEGVEIGAFVVGGVSDYVISLIVGLVRVLNTDRICLVQQRSIDDEYYK
jgi:hypothetical protein